MVEKVLGRQDSNVPFFSSQGNDKLEFTHYLLLSRVYKMEGMDDESNVGFGEAERYIEFRGSP